MNCPCRLCAGRQRCIPSTRPISPLLPSSPQLMTFDTPPSPRGTTDYLALRSSRPRLSISIPSPTLSISDTLVLPSPESPYPIPAPFGPRHLSPVSPYTPVHCSPTTDYPTAPPSPVYTISDSFTLPSPESPYPIPASFSQRPRYLSAISLISASEFVCHWNPRPKTYHYSDEIHFIPSYDINSSIFGPRWQAGPLMSPFAFSKTNANIDDCVSPTAGAQNPSSSWSVSSCSLSASPSSASDSIGQKTLASAKKPNKKPIIFTNTPWWHGISLVSPPTPISSVGSSSSSLCMTPSRYYKMSSSTTTNRANVDPRSVFWTRHTSTSAAEYQATFGQSVDADEYAWIRYPVNSVPHNLHSTSSSSSSYFSTFHTHSSSSSVSNDETYDEDGELENWNPTTPDPNDPFANFDCSVDHLGLDDFVNSTPLSVSASVSSNSANRGRCVQQQQ
jgi:hypothetical protein